MKSAEGIFEYIIKELQLLYEAPEARSIGYRLLEEQFGISKSDVVSDKGIHDFDSELLHKSLMSLKDNVPVHYIIGKCEFYGLDFLLDNSVLIPRPETEELVDRIIQENRQNAGLKILDIGSGSGCIGICLSKFLTNAKVYATDVSRSALEIAEKNNLENSTGVKFQLHDILTQRIEWTGLDLIVSNPPYVLNSEKKLMRSNVLDHEPHEALFVEDTDPLIFYRTIQKKALMVLKTGGSLYFEINEKFGAEVKNLLERKYHSVKVLKDMQGKDRMVTAIKS